MKINGFTLIELMIVVAIISILSIVAIPTYQHLIYKSRTHACLSEAKGYSNYVFYAIYDYGNRETLIAPVPSACESITSAVGWDTSTQQKIVAIPKSVPNTKIECDVLGGGSCKVVP